MTRNRFSHAQRLELSARAYEMHVKHGKSFRQIGQELGISHETARTYVTEIARDSSAHLVTATREFILANLDDVLATSAEIVHGEHSDLSAKTNANGVRLRAIQELAKLFGSYAPTQIEQTITKVEPEDVELRQLISEAKARAHKPIADQVPEDV